METTALPKNVGIKTMLITYTKENLKLNIAYSDGKYRIDTPCWQFSDFEELKALFDCLPMPCNTEVEVKPQPQPIEKAPAPKKAAKPAKKVRKNQFAKRWTDEQKREIAERYKNGEGPSAIAKDYNVTPNTIQQICIRMGAKRGKVDPEVEEAIRRIEEASRRKKTDLPSADKLETPAEQEEREKKQKKALKEFRERQDLPWYLKDNSKRKSKD